MTVEKAFYNSYLYPANQTQAADAGLKFFTVQTFTEDTLPVGSIIVNTEGRNIRLERWIDGTVKNSDGSRGSTSTAKQHVVDASWWHGCLNNNTQSRGPLAHGFSCLAVGEGFNPPCT